MQLDMKPYTTRAKKRASKLAEEGRSLKPILYDLLSVVVHKGEINSGHYIMYARHQEQWFEFDDSKVILAKEKDVLSAQAYLLFYVVRNLS